MKKKKAVRARARWTAEDVLKRLEVRYAPPEWVLLSQVGNGTGWRQYRWMDALAMNLWPSRGMSLIGFEIKVRRGDWLTELRNPEKQESHFRFCSSIYLVTPPEDETGHTVACESEIPEAWGWLEARTGKASVCVKKDAPPTERIEPTWQFVAAILRRVAASTVRTTSIDDKMNEKYVEGRKAGERDAEGTRQQLDRLVSKLREFQEASGIDVLNEWNMGNIGDAVRALRDGDPVKRAEKLLNIINSHSRDLRQFLDAHEEVRGL